MIYNVAFQFNQSVYEYHWPQLQPNLKHVYTYHASDLPAEQLPEGSVIPGVSQNCPPGQGRHSDSIISPVRLEYVPSGHFTQSLPVPV